MLMNVSGGLKALPLHLPAGQPLHFRSPILEPHSDLLFGHSNVFCDAISFLQSYVLLFRKNSLQNFKLSSCVQRPVPGGRRRGQFFYPAGRKVPSLLQRHRVQVEGGVGVVAGAGSLVSRGWQAGPWRGDGYRRAIATAQGCA